MTTFVDMYHPALGNVHISVPDIPAALSLYEAHGWVLSVGGGPDPTPIDLTVGLGDLRYAKLGDIPTAGTATGDALRAAFRLALPQFEGIPLYSYGNSFGNLITPIINISPAGAYARRVESRLRPASHAYYWNNGYQMQDVAGVAIGDGGVLAPGSKGLVILEGNINDSGWNVSDTVQRAGYQESLNSFLRVARAGERIEDSDGRWTYPVGSWTHLTAAAPFSGGTLSYSTDAGARASCAFTATETRVQILTYAKTDGSGATVVAALDGATVATRNLQTIGKPSFSKPGNNWIPVAIDLGVVPAGSHTATLTWSAGTSILLDCLLIESATPPTVLISKPIRPTAAAYLSFYGTGRTEANRAAYDTIIDTVVATYPSDGSVLVADPNAAGWDESTMEGPDGLHPNDRGMAHIAATVVNKLATVGFRAGQNILA